LGFVGRAGRGVSHELVDAGDTFGGVVAFNGHGSRAFPGRGKHSRQRDDCRVQFCTVSRECEVSLLVFQRPLAEAAFMAGPEQSSPAFFGEFSGLSMGVLELLPCLVR
jgi:hypothetical protein